MQEGRSDVLIFAELIAAMESGHSSAGGRQRGRLVDLREEPPNELVLVGDIHAKWERIPQVVEHAGLHPKLASGQAILVFLGDLFHREDHKLAGEMESSVRTFEEFARLKVQYPKAVYALLGNHEFTRGANTKRGFFQGALFRETLVARGLYDIYSRWLELSPMVVAHPRVVGVHAGPAISVTSLEELCDLEVADIPPLELPPALRQLSFFRHRDWSGHPERAYSDHQINDFLKLCGVPGARLVTGHTPLDRETDWHWEIGEYLTVIFAAGRELGYGRVTSEGLELVRVGRAPTADSQVEMEEKLELFMPRGAEVYERHGHRSVVLHDLSQEVDLQPGVTYRFSYRSRGLNMLGTALPSLEIRHYRHLQPHHQSDLLFGTYLQIGRSPYPPLLLKRHKAVLLGGQPIIDGTRFDWANEEMLVLRQEEEGEFELRALRPGFRLKEV